MRLHFTLGILFSTALLQACNAGPESTRPTVTSQAPLKVQQPMPVSAEDQKFADLLKELSQRNPKLEAQQSIASGNPFLLAYYSGRAGLKVPGLTSEQQAKKRCPLKTIDGLGDVIYGENHLKYRIAMRNFAKIFNTNMSATCF